MITEETQLKLQAFLDGELSTAEAAGIKAGLDRDPEARALLAELRNTKSALVGHEAGWKLPESREFFWSKIQREIERQEAVAAEPSRRASWLAWLRGHFLPLSGVALLTCLLGGLYFASGVSAAPIGETELASDDMGSETYRDQSENVTAVWLYNRGDESPADQPASPGAPQPE